MSQSPVLRRAEYLAQKRRGIGVWDPMRKGPQQAQAHARIDARVIANEQATTLALAPQLLTEAQSKAHGARSCFVCGASGICIHREPELRYLLWELDVLRAASEPVKAGSRSGGAA